jgi:F-type H+-transporting ATPase subunit b
MSLLTPDLGLLFWMMLNFLIVFGLLAKFGFPVITKMVGDRQAYIGESLEAAAEAQRQLAGITQQSQALLEEARRQQSEILKKAITDGEHVVRAAQQKAVEETEKQLVAARKNIELQKDKALGEINAQVALLSVNVAEKLLRRQLDGDKEQEQFIMQMLDEADAAK